MTHEMPNWFKNLIAGWPVYSVIGVGLLLFSELWIDRRVDDRIVAHHAAQPSLTDMDKKLDVQAQTLTNMADNQARIEGQLTLLTTHLLEND
jgi:hypothetical protein